MTTVGASSRLFVLRSTGEAQRGFCLRYEVLDREERRRTMREEIVRAMLLAGYSLYEVGKFLYARRLHPLGDLKRGDSPKVRIERARVTAFQIKQHLQERGDLPEDLVSNRRAGRPRQRGRPRVRRKDGSIIEGRPKEREVKIQTGEEIWKTSPDADPRHKKSTRKRDEW